MTTDSEKLRKLRNKFNLTQQELADTLAVSKGLIAAIEGGTRNLSRPMIHKINYTFNLNIMQEETQITTYPNNILVPFYTAKASAGTGEELPEYQESEVLHFDRRWLQNVVGINPDNATIIQAKGDSMQPLIKDGDLLMVDISQKEPVNGQVFVVRIEKDLFVKRVSKEWNGDWILVSDNKDYDNINPDSYTEVIGRVVYNASKETL